MQSFLNFEATQDSRSFHRFAGAQCRPQRSRMSDDQSECEEKLTRPIYTEQTVINKYEGVLFKWTNFLYGWQERFFVLKDGLLSYYKSQDEKLIGCRGAISIQKAKVKVSADLPGATCRLVDN